MLYSTVLLLHNLNTNFMKRLFSSQFLGILYLAIFSFSCSSDLDFNQTKNLRVEPTYIANLMYFDIPANEFVTNGIETAQFIDRSTVAIFNNTFFVNDLVKTDLDFEINNTIARAFTLEVKLFNANGTQLDTIVIAVPAYYGPSNIITQKEVFQGTRLTTLKNTTRIEMTLRMASGTALTESSTGTIKMRSGVTSYFVIQ
jgi:hypothetical protein